MDPLTIASLLIKFGPPAFDMIRHLADIWSKPTLTPEEVKAFCDKAQKPYDAYIAEERANRGDAVAAVL